MESKVDQKPAAVLAIFQLPGANLIEISDRISSLIDELRPSFPSGVDVSVTYDAADAVRASISEIVTTLFIAAGLVILTVLVFLQDFRATLIPAVTIPVSLIGTFAVSSWNSGDSMSRIIRAQGMGTRSSSSWRQLTGRRSPMHHVPLG